MIEAGTLRSVEEDRSEDENISPRFPGTANISLTGLPAPKTDI